MLNAAIEPGLVKSTTDKCFWWKNKEITVWTQIWLKWVFIFSFVTIEGLLVTVPASSIYSKPWTLREQNYGKIGNLIMQPVLCVCVFPFLKCYISFKKVLSSKERVHWLFNCSLTKLVKPFSWKERKINDKFCCEAISDGRCWDLRLISNFVH